MKTKPVILLLAALSALLIGSCTPNPLAVPFLVPGAGDAPAPAPAPAPNPTPDPDLAPAGDYVTLTKAEIFAAMSLDENITSDFTDVTIKSKSGDWTGNMFTERGQEYIWLRNNKHSHLKSPSFDKNISKIELKVTGSGANTPVAARVFWAINPGTDLVIFDADYYNADFNQAEWVFVEKFGSASSVASQASLTQSVIIPFTGDTKRFILIAYDGEAYISSVRVYFN